MNSRDINNNILHTLRCNPDIIDNSAQALLYHQVKPTVLKIESFTAYTFDFPWQIAPDQIDGYKLKDGKGFISFSETYKLTNTGDFESQKLAYVYRYITDEYKYECSSNSPQHKNKIFNYKFHYDKNIFYSHSDPVNHLQVLHSFPRFNVAEISIQVFIEFIKKMRFNQNSSYSSEPIYLLN